MQRVFINVRVQVLEVCAVPRNDATFESQNGLDHCRDTAGAFKVSNIRLYRAAASISLIMFTVQRNSHV